MMFVIAWLSCCLLIFSLAHVNAIAGGQKDIAVTPEIYVMLGFMCFGGVWLLTFISSKTSFIYMYACSSYYFSSSKNSEGSGQVMQGVRFSYFKHAGSLAFGSCIHSIVIIVRMITEILLSGGDSDDGAAKLVACLVRCCVGCIESLIEHLNITAYAYMAISGENYCNSAWNGLLLNLKHLAKFVFATDMA